jgi:hypothetical protein
MIIDHERKFKKLIPWVLLASLLVIFLAGPAYCQSNEDRARTALEKCDNLIERARQPVRESGNPQAQQYLEKAIYLQGQAKENFAGKRYGQAMRLAEMAEAQAMKAIGMIRQGDENRDMVQKEIERTDELLQRAREQYGNTENVRAKTVFQNALEFQNKARDLFARNRQKMALTSTLNARELARKAQEMAQDHAQALKEIEKTDQLLQRARERLAEMSIGLNPPAFERALRLQELARSSYVSGNFEQALGNTLKARKQIMDAVENFDDKLKQEYLPRALEQLGERLGELNSALAGTDQDHIARSYYERAKEELQNARENFNKGETSRAVQHSRRAKKYLDEAMELINP